MSFNQNPNNNINIQYPQQPIIRLDINTDDSPLPYTRENIGPISPIQSLTNTSQMFKRRRN
jgi:hypothetical protein